MEKLISISLYLDREEYAKCDHIALYPYATSTARKFFFQNVRSKKEISFSDRDRLSVRVGCFTKHNKFNPIYEFSILLLDFEDHLKWIYGLVYNDFGEEYRQGIVDIFSIWEKGEKCAWFSLPSNGILKEDYIAACQYYSSVSSEIIEKDVYEIDMLKVKEYRDILYLVSEEFFGERGYIGHSFHTFADCLLVISQKSSNLEGKHLILKNSKNVFIEDDKLFFEDFKKELLSYNLSIEER